MTTLSVRLRELRGPTSQAEMAKGIGIPQQAWARYEKGVVAPNATTIVQICRVHACSADWLLGLDDKSCGGRNNSARAGSGGIAIAGSGNSVTGVVAGAPTTAACAKCPYKKKLKALEKLIQK